MRNEVGTIKVAVEPRYLSLNQPEMEKNGKAGVDVIDRNEPNSDIVEIYLAQAQAYADNRQWEKAVTACKEALAITPQAGIAYKMLGTLYQQQGKMADAMGFYAKALSLQAHFPEVYSNLGSLYAAQKKWEKATEYYQKAIAQAPQFAPAHLNLAKVWKQLGNEEAAQKSLITALKLKPDLGTAEEHYTIAQSLEASNKGEEAIFFYRQSIQQTPPGSSGTAAAYQRLADLLEEQGDWQAATECYHKVLELNEGHSATASGSNRPLPKVTSPQGMTPQATPYQTIPLRSGTSQPVILRSMRAQSAPQGTANPSQKVPNLSRLSKSDQNRIHQLIQASSRKKLLRPASSAKALLAASSNPSLPPQIVSRRQQMGRQPEDTKQRLKQVRNRSQIIERLKQAIRKTPRSAALYRNLAKAFDLNDQKRQSAEAWFKAFVLEPDWPSAAQYFELGKALDEQKNLKAAAYCYGHAIRQQPDFRAAQLRLGQLAMQSSANTVTQNTAIKSRTSQNGAEEGSSLKNSTRVNSAPRNSARLSAQALSQAQAAAANAAHKQGEASRKANDWEAAVEAYKKATRLYPTFSWSHHSLGDCYKKLENWAAAADAYRQAISLNDEFVWSYYSLAEVLEQQEAWPAAAECYRRARAIAPDNEQIPPRLASVLKTLIKQSPRNIELYKALGEQQLVQGKTEDAISTYQMGLQIAPTDTSIALALSKLLSDRDPHQAHMLIDRALAETTAPAHPFAVAQPSHASGGNGSSAQQDEQASLTASSSDAAILNLTHLFDPLYYRTAHPNVATEVGTDDPQALLNHYLSKGSEAGYNPNPLFDDRFYSTHQPEVLQQRINPLVHYYQSGYKTGADPHPFFSTQFYTQLHEDVAAANVNPLEHYLAYGAKEGRAAFSAKQFTHLLASKTPEQESYTQTFWQSKGAAQTKQQQIGVYCNSLGNYFITEIADFIAAALTQAGHKVTRLSEQDTIPESLDAHWVIAPHEFFYLGNGDQWMQKQDWLARAVMVNVEQPQTTWFSKAFHFLRHTSIIFDINVKSAAILQKLGLPAYWLPLGYLSDYAPFEASARLPNLRALGSLSPAISQTLPTLSAPLKERPIDLHFIGTLNPRRETFFAQSACWLSKHHSFLHIPPMGVPLLKGQDQALDTETVIGLSRRSKILLNIHRDELPYFEWHRIIFHGLWQNTLVVTEPCHDIPGLVAGEHFIECSLENMPDKLDWLLKNPEGQKLAERVRTAGHEVFSSKFNGANIMAKAAELAEKALFRQ